MRNQCGIELGFPRFAGLGQLKRGPLDQSPVKDMSGYSEVSWILRQTQLFAARVLGVDVLSYYHNNILTIADHES
jgi:hypothetical protein